jgi:GT2 family glycosyltransferase
VVAEPDCAARLVAALDAYDAWAAQPLMMRRGGDLVDTLGHKLLDTGLVVDISEGAPLSPGVEGQDWEVFSICAGAALYRADVFRRVGLLAEDFFIYYEDVDLGFRIRLNGGKALLVPSARARHTRHGSAGGFALKHYYAERNLLAVRLRHSTVRRVVTRDTVAHLARGFLEALRHRRVGEYTAQLARALATPRVAGSGARATLAREWTGVERRPLAAPGKA